MIEFVVLYLCADYDRYSQDTFILFKELEIEIVNNINVITISISNSIFSYRVLTE